MNKAGAKISNEKPSLILLHNRHSTRIAQSVSDEATINRWKKEKALYFTPQGSNDDWYCTFLLPSLVHLLLNFFLNVSNFFTCYVRQVLVICCSQVQVSSCDQWRNARSHFWAFGDWILSQMERKAPGICLYIYVVIVHTAYCSCQKSSIYYFHLGRFGLRSRRKA